MAEPGDPGWSWGKGIKAAFNVAKGYARKLGAGLPLVNAILNRFPGFSKQEAGTLATGAAGAIQAADKLNALAPDAPILSAEPPVMVGASLFEEAPSDRWQVETISTWEDSQGVTSIMQTTITGTANITKGEFDELANLTTQEARARYYQGKKAAERLAKLYATSFITQY